MREIKFRAWDEKTKKMYYNIQNLYDGMGDSEWSSDKIYDTGIPCDSFGSVLESDTPVMQYTGLKDKNGTEIYEGDILRESARFASDKEFVYGRVIWKDCGFFFRRLDCNLTYLLSTCTNSITFEVVE